MQEERKKSPTGRLHVHPNDRVKSKARIGIGRVIRLDARESHVEAEVHWQNGRKSWEDLNILTLVDKEGRPVT